MIPTSRVSSPKWNTADLENGPDSQVSEYLMQRSSWMADSATIAHRDTLASKKCLPNSADSRGLRSRTYLAWNKAL